mmetsp:Transcript_3867/g.8421  ORF Transcript_3867/g.8421 Transcript_3867/m.8421 type:complete len:311 (+) Transcript_3867:614-1546(+)
MFHSYQLLESNNKLGKCPFGATSGTAYGNRSNLCPYNLFSYDFFQFSIYHSIVVVVVVIVVVHIIVIAKTRPRPPPPVRAAAPQSQKVSCFFRGIFSAEDDGLASFLYRMDTRSRFSPDAFRQDRKSSRFALLLRCDLLSIHLDFLASGLIENVDRAALVLRRSSARKVPRRFGGIDPGVFRFGRPVVESAPIHQDVRGDHELFHLIRVDVSETDFFIPGSLARKELHFMKVLDLFDLFLLDNHIKIRWLVPLTCFSIQPQKIVLGTEAINANKTGHDSIGGDVQDQGKWWSQKAQPKTQDGVLPGEYIE